MIRIRFLDFEIVAPTDMSSTTKKARIVGELGCFVLLYARKAQKQRDPNDRRYDERVEKAIQRMRPVAHKKVYSALSGSHPIKAGPGKRGLSLDFREVKSLRLAIGR